MLERKRRKPRAQALYLQRLSVLLRQGEPVADVALYAPTEDAWATFRPGLPLNLFRKIVDLVGGAVVPSILDAGYGFDLVDDGTLGDALARPYRAIVLPNVRSVPEATRRRIPEELELKRVSMLAVRGMQAAKASP